MNKNLQKIRFPLLCVRRNSFSGWIFVNAAVTRREDDICLVIDRWCMSERCWMDGGGMDGGKVLGLRLYTSM